MRRSAVATSAWKEFRALFPLWLACAIPVIARDLVSGYFLPMIATLAYGFGSIALGAQSVGHEFGYGTVGVLLAQPVDRRRMYAVKLAVLAAFLGILWFAASLTLFDEREFRSAAMGGPPPHLAPIIALCGLFLAPVLTMATRSWIAGSVFTVGLTGMLWTGLMLAGMARFGISNAGAQFAESVFWPAMYAVCGGAAIAGWWMFGRLEAFEGRGAEIQLRLPWSRAVRTGDRATQTSRPMGRLAAKELHLHQMAFVLAGLYLVAVAAGAAARAMNPQMDIHPAIPITVFYGLTVVALVGAFASAEDRQLGTRDWQQLMPIAAWKQWTVKVAVAMGLSAALGVGLPAAVSMLVPASRLGARDLETLPYAMVALTAWGVYVSSLSSSGIRALLAMFPALFAIGYTSQRLAGELQEALVRWGVQPFARVRFYLWMEMTAILSTASLVLLILAYQNHRSGDVTWKRVALQVVLLLAVFVAVALASWMLRL
jgi:hypothetical protein